MRAYFFLSFLWLAPLSAWAQCPASLHIGSNADAQAFALAYPNCTAISGNVSITGSAVTDLQGLSQIERIGGTLHIYQCSQLADLAGLSGLHWVGGDLLLQYNALGSLAGLGALDSVMGQVQLYNHSALGSLGGLSGLRHVGGRLSLEVLPQIGHLQGLGRLRHVGGGLALSNLPALQNLSGLDSLAYIGDLLRIHACGQAATAPDLSGLLQCAGVDGDVEIVFNANFADLGGLENLAYLNGLLLVQGNSGMVSLSGLEGLAHLGGGLKIEDMPHLTSLEGLDSLQSIGQYLRLKNNPSLASLQALAQVQSLGGYLYVHNNDALPNLNGIGQIAPASISKITLTNNNSLSDCQAAAVCGFLAEGLGEIIVSGNSGACASVADLGAACPAENGPCLAPAPPIIVPQSPTSLHLSWPAQANATSYALRWRQTGPNPWSSDVLAKNYTTLEGLLPHVAYAFRFRTKCGPGELSDPSSIYNYSTPSGLGDCAPPQLGVVDSIAPGRVRVYWHYVPGATGYRLQLRPLGSSAWSSRLSNEPNVFLNNLDQGLAYEYRVRAICPGGETAYSLPDTFAQAGPMPSGRALPEAAQALPNVAPNPSRGQATLFLPEGHGYTLVRVFDSGGRLQWASPLPLDGPCQLSLRADEWPAGLYVLQLSGPGVVPQALRWLLWP